LALLLPVGLLLTGCSSGDSTAAGPLFPAPSTSSGPAGDLSKEQLLELLLQPDDLPDLPRRREFASPELSTQPPPQLALCQEAAPTAPHATANVLAQNGQAGQVQVFQVLSVYTDPAGARAAYDKAVADARACRAYQAQGRSFAVEDLAEVEVPAGATASHYRLTTPEVVSGDVRTIAVSGRYVILVTGYGAAPNGQSIRDYQADVLRRALARVG
jgi:hypothetical protein